MGWSRRVSDNRPASNQLRLARAPRGGLRGPRPQSIRPPLQAAPSGATPCRVCPSPGEPVSTSVACRSPVTQCQCPTDTRSFSLSRRRLPLLSMRWRKFCRRNRRPGCNRRCMLEDGAGTFPACLSLRIGPPRGTHRRGRWSSELRLSPRTSRLPLRRLPALRPDTGPGAGSIRHANGLRSRCCSCGYHNRTPAPTPSCRRWAVGRTRLGPRLHRNTALRCNDKRGPLGTRLPHLRDRSSPRDHRARPVLPCLDTRLRFAGTLRVSEPRRC